MNVLLTCAGRRTSLLHSFRAAVAHDGGRVLASDVDELAPAMLSADDAVVMPPVSSDAYLSALVAAVEEHDIDLIVPTIDPALPILHEGGDDLATAGARVLISDTGLLELAADKWKMLHHLSDQGVRTPSSWRPEDADAASLPDSLFVKPRRGSSSHNAHRIPRHRLGAALELVETPIIQEAIDAPEITVDALFDFSGTLLHYVPRLRIKTVGGESVQGRTLPDEEFGPWIRAVLSKIGTLGARGPITLQAFLTDDTPTFSEVNPRFGGGFPLAHEAGAHYPAWIVDLCNGAHVAPRLGAYRAGVCMSRAYTEYFTDGDDC